MDSNKTDCRSRSALNEQPFGSTLLDTLPIQLLRQQDLPRIERVLGSPRFRSVRDQLFSPVHRADFSGHWICRNSIAKSEEPRRSAVTILFSHGGGYVAGDAPTYLSLLLRLAESVENQGLTVSVFMLDYSLAPESPFPAQLEQMNAAYRYLIEEELISPGKIALVGDSAGGNLLLSFLTSLHSPLSPSSPKFSEPFLGLFLVSPWVSLTHSGSSFRTNGALDILRKSTLDYWASNFQAGSHLDPRTIQLYTEFGHEDKDRPSLGRILPKRLAVTAGEDELMMSDITSFAERARKGGIQVSLSIASRMVHDWQLQESGNGEAAYLQVPQPDFASAHLPGTVALGRLIAECVQVA
ncbi:Alpha/Beta hydrolase protein [Xylariales sp. AK1849]|nr:Alpha/Beta hydrolase protein [Xylariales sp. AK1849]